MTKHSARLRKGLKRAATSLAPSGSARRKLAKRLLRPNSPTFSYESWIKKCEPGVFLDTTASDGPLITIVVPCFNTPQKYLTPLVESVINQTYLNWQLCLADGSVDEPAKQRIEGIAAQDKRINYVDVGGNLGIVGNTNVGIKQAAGEYIAFLDHDDVLSKHALNEVVHVIADNPKADLFYSDEDKLSDDGKTRQLPFFKPDWSPELLLSVNYITHFVVARKSLVDKIGGLRPGFDGAQDYDFLLRLTEKTKNIVHIPKILYHWRLAEGSTSKQVSEKNYADTAGQQALRDAVKRRGVDAKVLEIKERPTNYRLQYQLPSRQPKVSVIIPFKDKADLLKQCVGSILKKTIYQNYELVLISNNSTEQELLDYLEELKKDKRCKVVIWDHPFNYAAINNFGRTQASGEYLILLNNDTEVITPGWIEELVGVASQPQNGAVGAMLFYPNDTLQHAGVILGLGGMAGHVFRYRVPLDWTDFGMPCWPRNYLAVTAACLAIQTKKYDQVGGLDEKFIIAGNDVALGIKLHEAGYRNVYWPFAELYHHENSSVGPYSGAPASDYDHSLTYYRPYLKWQDPYFNPNLDLMNEQVVPRSVYE